MKFTYSSTIFLAVTLASSSLSSSSAAYSPVRISFENLEQGNAEDVLRQALQEVGMISITNIPSNFSSQKMATMKLLPKCMEESNRDGDDERTRTTTAVVEHTFEDGTRRRTMATHNVGTESSASSFLIANNHPSCQEFQAESQSFRQTVGHVMDVFADELAIALNLDASKTLLEQKKDQDQDQENSMAYNLRNIFGQGEQLEHFHCYYNTGNDDKDQPEEDNNEQKGTTTLEWHTDQGLVLAFTPGLINGETTKGFYIELKDGSTEMVDFDKTDDLVFLMGDGVHQYLNGALLAEPTTAKPLRALPHALQMPTEEDPRVWYGRMVLPPPNAKHPLHPQMTFGEIRKGMMEEDPMATSIGCSQEHHQDNKVARELQDTTATSTTTCEEGTAAYCWHRCMNYTDYNVTEQGCMEDGNKTLACVNDDGFLWPGIHDPQFKLGCASSDAVNWTVTADDDSKNDTGTEDHDNDHGHSHGDDEEKTHTGGNSTDLADSSTGTIFLGISFVLGTIMTLSSL